MAGEGDCPICERGGPADTIVALDASWVTAPPRAALPGYVCVVARTHVDEPFDLDGLERRRYWEEMLLVARAVRDTTGAAKMNYEIHGNTIPHLHTHLYPRFPGDPFAGRPIDGAALTFERTPGEIDRLVEVIQRAAGMPPARTAGNRAAPAAYDEMASWFDELSGTSFYNAEYDRPAVLGLVGDVGGDRVLDVGCGAGHYLVALLARGARVVGVDGSAELLRRARARVGSGVELIHHDLERPLSMLADASFDGAILALVYHHIDDRTGLLAELKRVIKPGGWLVLSTSHPVADWLQQGGSYFTMEKVDVAFGRQGDRWWRVPFWRMSLTTLLGEILGAGFELERLVEPVPPPATREIDARRYDRLTREPAFLAIRARPASGAT
jgi:ubiquinone/menaquinone biosynthesis C-methylase UbiE/diadenosine tetraphosphate (Ap4A) HIT family hydrolase